MAVGLLFLPSWNTRRLLLVMLYLLRHSSLWRGVGSFRLPSASSSSFSPLSRLSFSSRMSSTSSSPDDMLSNQVEVSVADALACHQTHPDRVAFFDGSWWLGQPDKARRAFEAGPRIAGAHFYDIDDVSSKTPELNPKGLPHMMPTPALQAAYMTACGVTNDHHVIVYGQTNDCPYVHRAFFQILAMGHGAARTHLLAGSLQDWIQAGGPVETEPTRVPRVDELPPMNSGSVATTYHATDPGKFVVTMQQLQEMITKQQQQPYSDSSTDNDIQIVDARSAERFLAQVDEPRPGLRRGHMPGAQNLCFQDVLQSDSPVQLRDAATLRQMLRDQLGLELGGAKEGAVPTTKRIVATCGSGATGCTILAALLKAGYDPDLLTLYDGSWMEWGADPNAPLVDERSVQ